MKTIDTKNGPVWPTTPAEVGEFIGSNCISVRKEDPYLGPDENDVYRLTAHDLISAFSAWASRVGEEAILGGAVADLVDQQTKQIKALQERADELAKLQMEIERVTKSAAEAVDIGRDGADIGRVVASLKVALNDCRQVQIPALEDLLVDACAKLGRIYSAIGVDPMDSEDAAFNALDAMRSGRDALTTAIQMLNASTYSMTKSECIAMLGELRAELAAPRAQEPAPAAPVVHDFEGELSAADLTIAALREDLARAMTEVERLRWAAPQPAAPHQPLTDEQIDDLMPPPDGMAEVNVIRLEVLPGVIGTEFDEADAWSRERVIQTARAIERACAEQWGVQVEGGAA